MWESFVRTQGDRVGIDRGAAVPARCSRRARRCGTRSCAGIARVPADVGIDLAAYDSANMMQPPAVQPLPERRRVLVFPDEFQVVVARPATRHATAELVVFVLRRGRPQAAGTSRRRHLCPPKADFGLVLNQDVGVLQRVQRGMHQPGFTHLTLSSEECRIVNLHRNLERYLDISPTELTPL